MKLEEKKITQADIAKRCGVSTATVSMALTGKGNISDQLREQIQHTAIKLGYKKRIKRNITGRSVAILSFITPDWAYLQDFVTPIFTQIQVKLTAHNLFPFIVPVTNMTSNLEIKETVYSSQAVSVVSLHYANEPLFKEFSNAGLPITIINNSSLQKQFYSVCVDDYQGAYDGAKYLIENNHKNILYMDYWRRNQPEIYMDRFIGFKKAIDEHNIQFESTQRITFEIEDQMQIRSGVFNILKLYPDTTAIFVHDDRLAIRIHTELIAHGYKVPEHISIIAPGDTLNYSLPYIPKLTTMKIDTNLLGSLSADSVIERTLKTSPFLSSIKVTQQLMTRESCRKI